MTDPAQQDAQTPAPANDEMKAVTQEEVLNRVRGLSGKIIKTAILAAVISVVLMPAGLILGGMGGAAVAGHFALGWWATAGATTLGVGLGAVGAFFGAKALIADKVSELVIGTGLTAGEMGLRSLLRLLKQARQQKPGAAAAAEPAHVEKALEKTHKGVTWLRDFFGEVAEQKATNTPANDTAVSAQPPLPKPRTLP
ncbi:MAG: hypothetical protein ACAH83_15985 [Alphaproteobacteria bacterium]